MGQAEGVIPAGSEWSFDRGDEAALSLMAATWQPGGKVAWDGDRTRRFLAAFAVYLVKQFKAEEAQLDQRKAPGRRSHQQEHHRLAAHLRDLMAAAELGLEVTSEIDGFLQAWRRHQARPEVQRRSQGASSH